VLFDKFCDQENVSFSISINIPRVSFYFFCKPRFYSNKRT
jgi:hypothetical protein